MLPRGLKPQILAGLTRRCAPVFHFALRNIAFIEALFFQGSLRSLADECVRRYVFLVPFWDLS